MLRIVFSLVGLVACGAAFAGGVRFTAGKVPVGVIESGEVVFSNRAYAFSAEAAERLRGKAYFQFSNQDAISLVAEAGGNSFYTSYTVVDGQGVLWFNDMKYYLLGRKIGPEWFISE